MDAHKVNKICPGDSCKAKGLPLPLDNFRIKSRNNEKVYRNKFCKDCEKTNRRKSNSIIKKTVSPTITTSNSVALERMPRVSKLLSEIEIYNNSTIGHKVTYKEFLSIINLFQILDLWKNDT